LESLFNVQAELNINHNIQIANYTKLCTCFKKKYGYRARKSKILSKEGVDNFLQNAPDEKYEGKSFEFLEEKL
jgi:hypothetical protein